MMLAWLSSSEMTASCSSSSVSNSAAVGVEARGVQDRVVGAEERAQPLLELSCGALRAADEPHRRHAVAVAVERRRGGRDDVGMVGEAEVVVGAEVDHVAAAGADVCALRPREDPLPLEQAARAELGQVVVEACGDRVVHDVQRRTDRRRGPRDRGCGGSPLWLAAMSDGPRSGVTIEEINAFLVDSFAASGNECESRRRRMGGGSHRHRPLDPASRAASSADRPCSVCATPPCTTPASPCSASSRWS